MVDKALEMGKTSATGSFHLLIGVAGSAIIMAIGTLVLAALLPVNQVGLYGIALIPSTIINFFRDWGVNYAMTQQIASLRVQGKDAQIHDVILSGIIFEIITGILLSAVCFAVAEPLALILSRANAPNLTVYISIMSLSIFAGAISAAAGAIFTGFERMKLNSFTQIFQAVVKTSLGPLLIVIGFGVLGAIYAALTSLLAGGIVGILIVYFVLFRPLQKCKVGKCDVKTTLKPMLKFGLPFTVSNILVGVLPQLYAFIMAFYAGDWMMGNYYAAAYFSILLTFISIPIGTALFPAFSKLNPEKEPELVKTVFASSVKYTAFLLVPATMVLITLSTPLIGTLFPSNGLLQSLMVIRAAAKFPYAPLFLALSSLINLLVLFGNLSLGTFLTGIGKTNQIMKQSILSLAVGLPLAYVLVGYLSSVGGPSYAVIGGLVCDVTATMPAVAWGTYWCWKHYKIKIDYLISAKILVASLLASGITYLFIGFLRVPNVVMLVAGFVVFLVVFMTSAPLMGAVNRVDIDNFKAMFSGLGIVSKIIRVPLLYMRKMCRENGAKKVSDNPN